MTRRRISSMPAGMVIGALAVIALVALAALFLFGRPADGAYEYDVRDYPALESRGTAQ